MTAEGTLIALGNDASPREVTTRVSGTWTTPISVTGSTGDEGYVLALTEKLWFTMDNNDSNLDSFHFGPGSRSTDGGATWEATTTPPFYATATHPIDPGGGGMADISIAADGRLWCSWQDIDDRPGTRTVIYYSDDDGGTWVQSGVSNDTEEQTTNGWLVLCHPTNKDIIVVLTDGSNIPHNGLHSNTLYTTDRGNTWTETHGHSVRRGYSGFAPFQNGRMLSNGRIILQGAFGTSSPWKWQIKISDDNGLNWTETFLYSSSNVFMLGLYVNEDESVLGFIRHNRIGDEAEILYLSTDDGDNWNIQELDVELFLTSGETMAASKDTIYVGADQTEKVWQLTPVSSEGVWTQIDDGFPHSNVGDQFISVVQSIAAIFTYTADTTRGIVFSGKSVDVIVNIPPTPNPEDTIVSFHQFSATFRGSPSGAIRRLIKLG